MTISFSRPAFLRYGSGLLLVLALSSAAAAVTQLPRQTPDQAIRQTTEQLRALIRDNRAEYEADTKKFSDMVEKVVVSRFDTRYIGQIILGTHWRNASESQRQRFIIAFRNNLVHSYARALLEHADTVEIKWKPVHMAQNAKEATVNVDLLRQNGPPIPIGFAVHLVGAEWKVYDVTIDSVSLATTFRSQFTPEIRKNGIEGLIKRLETGEKPLEKAQKS